MKKLLLIVIIILFAQFSNATDLDTKIAASFAARYAVCGDKLEDAVDLQWKIKAGIARERAKKIGRERFSEEGYVKHLEKEKKKIRKKWNKKRCKEFLNDHLED